MSKNVPKSLQSNFKVRLRDKIMQKIIEILRKNNIDLDKGLSDFEIDNIEMIYSITFPPELRELYKVALPISKGFYNWREALDEKNISKYKEILKIPFDGIKQSIDEIDWAESWGEDLKDKKIKDKIIMDKLALAPKLIPVFDHRYMVSTSEPRFPVFSIVGWDIIYYGSDLENYFNIEFKLLDWEDMDFAAIKNVQFWSEIM